MRNHSKDEKIWNPQTNVDHPSNIVKERQLSSKEIRNALDTWERVARQLLTTGNEGSSS
jgi:hypothetical protein